MMFVVSYRVLVEDASGSAVELCSWVRGRVREPSATPASVACMPDLNVACQIKLPHNSAEGHGFHLRMLGNVNPDEGSHLGEKPAECEV